MIAVNSVASSVTATNPLRVKYLRLAEERGSGVSNLSEVEVFGKYIEEVARKFRLPSGFRSLILSVCRGYS